jgi:hypothetical protein
MLGCYSFMSKPCGYKPPYQWVQLPSQWPGGLPVPINWRRRQTTDQVVEEWSYAAFYVMEQRGRFPWVTSGSGRALALCRLS